MDFLKLLPLGTIYNSVKEEYGYLSSYDSNIEKLKEGADKLADLRKRVAATVEASERNLHTVGRNVEYWMEHVEDILKKAFEYDKVWCIDRLCPNLMKRYSEGKWAAKLIQEIEKYQEQGRQFITPGEQVSYPQRQAIHTSILPTTSEGLNSRIKLSHDIIEALKDDSVRLVGLCGMGGVGKTTMALEILRKAEQKDGLHFDEVVFVTVTRASDTTSVQQKIADSLGLKVKETDEVFRKASALKARLTDGGCGKDKSSKNVLLILDDVWEQLDFNKLGIPLEASEENRRCKVFFTSRNLDTCNQMKPLRVIKIEGLPWDEAWNLFQQESKESFARDHHLYQVATDIVKRCQGLPLGIVTIAQLLKGENDENRWRDILVRLNSSDLDDQYKIVYETLAVSYNFIESDETKSVFLLCCLFPEDREILIEDLLRFGIGLNMFAISSKIKNLRDRTYSCVNTLKNRHLLEDGSYKGFVKMHDLVRDTGLKIASTGENVFVVGHGGEVVRWPKEPECCTRISLRCHEMLQIPRGLRCPNLELLQLIGFSEPSIFPTNFFQGMGKLKVLILKGMEIQSYPFEVSKELRSLSLVSCRFPGGVLSPLIGNLEALMILSFTHSNIKTLPQEIGKLNQLRVLELITCEDLHTIDPGVLKSLIKLEELHMRRCDQLNMECLQELSSLTRLAALDIEKYKWKDMDDLYIVYGKLTRFKIRVGQLFDCDDFENLELHYQTLREEGIEVLFSKAEILHLSHCRFETRTCLNKSEAEDFSKLRKLTLKFCEQFVHLVQRDKREPSNVFQTLESLSLIEMRDLEDIFGGFFKCGEISELNGPLPSFQNLRRLYIEDCPRLKKLFPISKGLMKLEVLNIEKCVSMETLFWIERRGGEEEENAIMNVEFPQLKRLDLEDLPYVSEICKGVDSVMLPRLLELILKDVPKLTIPHFLNGKIVLTNQLEYLFVDGMHQGLQIDEHLDTGVFKLRRMRLENCDGLVATVASSHVFQKLMFLSDILIRGCPTVEVVFDLEGMINVQEPPPVSIMDSLEYLYLSTLPRMKHVWKHVPKGFEGFKNLTRITLEVCNSIGPSLFSPLIVKLLVKLQALTISWCDKMEVIVNEDDEVDPVTTVVPHKLGFPSLDYLVLAYLKNLRCFCSEPRDFLCPSLKFVEISDCPQLTTLTVEKSFTPSRRNNDDLNAAVEVTRPCLSKSEAEDFTVFRELNQNLRDVEIRNCPSLKNLFPISKGLTKLKKLRIKNCVSMETIFWVQRRGEEEENAVMNVVEFPQLKWLDLQDLPLLSEICEGGVHSVMPSSQNLRELEIQNCPLLKKIFWIPKGLTKLKKLRIKNCDSMETIFWVQRRGEIEEENAIMNVVEFPQLKHVFLEDLQDVTEICRGVDSVMLPRLTRLTLKDVPKLTAPNAGKIVLTSQLKELFVHNMHLKGIQIDEHLDTGVLNLRRMRFIDCDGLATVASSHVIQKLMSLQVIKIEKCPTVEVVFDLQGMINVQEAPAVAVMDSLYELELANLPRMTHVWKHVSKGFEGFKNLTDITLRDCDSIGPSLFSPLIVKLLVQLRHLSISRCEKIEVIVKEDEADPVATVVPHELEFPSLYSLRLEHLRILRCFCSEPHDFEWPSLESVEIRDCPQMTTFTVGESFAPSHWGIDDLNAAVKDQLPFTTESSESDKNSECDENSEDDEDSECDENSEDDEDSECDEDS